MTTPKELKALCVALDMDADAVAALPDKNVAVLNAIAENYEGDGDAETIPEALQNITAVAGNIGEKPEGTIEITSNGNNIDVAQYAKADVNVPSVVPSFAKVTVNVTGTSGTSAVFEQLSANGQGGIIGQYVEVNAGGSIELNIPTPQPAGARLYHTLVIYKGNESAISSVTGNNANDLKGAIAYGYLVGVRGGQTLTVTLTAAS